MVDLTDIKFDHDKDSVKYRELNGAVTHVQGGIVFSAGYVPIKYNVTHDMVTKETFVPEKSEKKKRATATPGELKGFKLEEKPDTVQVALKEDAASKAAEEFIE